MRISIRWEGIVTFQCALVGSDVTFGNESKFHSPSIHFPLSPVDRRLNLLSALSPLRLMKLLLDRTLLSLSAGPKTSGFGTLTGVLDGCSVGRSTAGM